MSSIEITVKTTDAAGKSTYYTRWAHARGKDGAWGSADNLGRDTKEHSDEAAARKAMAGWLRSQAARLEENSVEPVAPAPSPHAYTEQDAAIDYEIEKDALLSAAGLEDLL